MPEAANGASIDYARTPVNEVSATEGELYLPGRKPPISARALRLQADPEELPHPRRQVEGGNIAGHSEQFQAEQRHEVADDD